MEITPDDKKIVDLLSKLKKSNGSYPSDLLASRRQQYVRQIANVGMGIGIGMGIRKSLKNGNGGVGVATTVASKVVEIVLVAAIVIEAGTAAYLYRNKIASFIRSFTSPNVQQVVPQPNNASQNPVVNDNQQTPVPAISETPSGTSLTDMAGSTNSTTGNNNSNTNVNATPNPSDGNGNQYGQTPKPERTKDNNNNNNDNTGNGNK